MSKPNISTADITAYLDQRNPMSLKGADVSLVGDNNHLIFRVQKNDRVFAIRMVNPASYRSSEWIGMEAEFAILKALEGTGLGPVAYHLERNFSVPLMIQEFVEADCYNALKPLTSEQLRQAAYAIARLNRKTEAMEAIPLLEKYRTKSFPHRGGVWHLMNLDVLRRAPRSDVLKWVSKITPIAVRASIILSKHRQLFGHVSPVFHFDGGHTGNTYFRRGSAMFLDWQKLSFRNDPSFTLVRFATSAGDKKGMVSDQLLDTLVNAYLEVNPVAHFADMARVRLLERQVSDLVWVLWDYGRRHDDRPVEEGTSVVARYKMVQEMLRTF